MKINLGRPSPAKRNVWRQSGTFFILVGISISLALRITLTSRRSFSCIALLGALVSIVYLVPEAGS